MGSAKDSFECQGCEAILPDSVELIGGHHARLCVSCQNALHLAIRNSTARLALHRAEAEMAILIARTMADGRDRLAELLSLQEDDRAARAELYALAAQWVSERAAKAD
jgi:hypothetical protein